MMFTVLGASGFIGSHLTRYLRSAGHEVYTPARGDAALFDRELGHAVYAVGMTANYAANPHETVEAHVGFLSRVLREARFASLLYLSSIRLYDGCIGECREDTDLILNPGNPRHLFDLSKALGESLCRASGRAGVRIARLASVYADELDTDNFLHGLIKSVMRQKTVKLNAPPNAARDYIHMDDLCRLLESIAVSGKRPVYNVASGKNVSNERLMALMAELTGTRIVCGPPVPGLSAPRIRIEAIEADFNFHPAPLEVHLRRMFAAMPRLAAGG